MFRKTVAAGDIEAGLLAGMATGLNRALNGENRLQPRPFVFFQPGYILDFAANPLFDASCIFSPRSENCLVYCLNHI